MDKAFIKDISAKQIYCLSVAPYEDGMRRSYQEDHLRSPTSSLHLMPGCRSPTLASVIVKNNEIDRLYMNFGREFEENFIAQDSVKMKYRRYS